MKITGRSSSITNAFINSIIPVIVPTEEQVAEALSILGMTVDTFQCAYCGGIASEWDHLRPLVKDKKPTGYISEIHNLVPSCGKCNQSKGNKDWRTWMKSNAKLAPKARNIKDLQKRMDRLAAYEKWGQATQIDFQTMVETKAWALHWENWDRVQALLKEAQKVAAEINRSVVEAHSRSSKKSSRA